MASNAIAGVGTIFHRWDVTVDSLGGETGTWEKIAEITNISGPDKSRETIDVTSLDSTDGYREFIGSFRDAGSVSLSMNFTRTTYETMNDDYESESRQYYEIVLPDGTSLEFEGLVTDLPLEVTTDDAISADATIKVSGKVHLNSGSGSASAV
jgi:predicted secreted protein